MGRQILPNVKELYGTAEAVIPGLVIHILPVGITGLCLAGLLCWFAELGGQLSAYLHHRLCTGPGKDAES